MKLSFCAAIAGVQIAVAVGALALGHLSVAAAFGVFAVVQLIGVLGQRCGPERACETRLVAPDAPVPARQILDRQ